MDPVVMRPLVFPILNLSLDRSLCLLPAQFQLFLANVKFPFANPGIFELSLDESLKSVLIWSVVPSVLGSRACPRRCRGRLRRVFARALFWAARLREWRIRVTSYR